MSEYRIMTLGGNIRRDHFGRFVVDNCPSDEEHLRSSQTNPETNKPICRNLVEEAFSHLEGKTGTLKITLVFDEASSEINSEAPSCSAQPVTSPEPTQPILTEP